jgi:hypothetical protein
LGFWFVAKVIDIQSGERRRDRRRPVLLSGRLDGCAVQVVDVSLGGVGCAIELESGEDWTSLPESDVILEIDGRSGQTYRFAVRVTWINEDSGTFGATFSALSDVQFRVLEKLTLGRPI